MIGAVTAFLKPYLGWIIGGGIALVVGTFSWLAVDLVLTKSALQTAETKLEASEQIIAAQTRAMEAVERIDELEDQLDDLRRQGRARMAQAQGSTNAIPPEVSAAFIANSDSVLAYRGNPRAAEELHIPK